MSVWKKEDGSFDATKFVNKIRDPECPENCSMPLIENIGLEIKRNPQKFSVDSVHAFIAVAREVGGTKEGLACRCLGLVSKLDVKEVFLAKKEKQQKQHFSVKSDAVISLLQMATDSPLSVSVRECAAKISHRVIKRHPDYFSEVAGTIVLQAFTFPRNPVVQGCLKALWKKVPLYPRAAAVALQQYARACSAS